MSFLTLQDGVSASSGGDKLAEEAKVLQSKKENMLLSITIKNDEISKNQMEMKDLLEQLAVLAEETEVIEKDSILVEGRVIRIQGEIRELQDSIISLEDRIQKRDDILKNRMKAMQTKEGKINYLDVVLGSKSIVDLVERFTSVAAILKADKNIMDIQKDEVEQLDSEKKLLDKNLEDILKKKKELRAQKKQLKINKKEKTKIIDKMDNEQKTMEVEKHDLEMEYDELVVMAKDVESSIQDEQNAFYIAEQERMTGAYCSVDGEIDMTSYDRAFSDAGALTGKGDEIIEAAKNNKIDPVLMGAIILHETGNGTSNAVKSYNNPGGMMSPSSNWTKLTKYKTLEDGLEATGKTLKRMVHKEGRKTIPAIGFVYAPVGADNDPTGLNDHWVSVVNKNVEALGGLVGECEVRNTGSKNLIMPTTGTLTSPYGWRMHPVDHVLKEHRGMDIANVSGTKILSAADGKVTHAGWLTGFGNSVMITHIVDGKMITTVYGHMSKIGTTAGATVKQGDEIGKMGKTGKVTGVHLHFEVHEGEYTNFGPSAVNPLRYLGAK